MNRSPRPLLEALRRRLPGSRHRPITPPATLALALALAGCGQPAWNGTEPATCPALPLDVVAEVTQDLATDGAPDGSETGSLTETSSNVLKYGCRWPTTDGADGLKVSLQDIDPARAVATVNTLKHWEGPELTAGDEGYGRADVNGGRGEAQWVCGDLTGLAPILSVTIYSPKEGTDPAVDAQRLAEAILEIVEC